MGATVSNLQILGAPEETVRAALPGTLVGRWSERFVTACPNLAFQHLERKAGTLSKKLDCTVLAVSMFDGDAVSLAVFQSGKRLTVHSVDIETGDLKAGNPKQFCSALGLPEELSPKLKQLFTSSEMQEEKLSILQALLGAPLFVRWDDPADRFPKSPLRTDFQPLERWVEAHPEPPKPPKIKNQCRAELIQEITGWACGSYIGGSFFLFRPLFRVGDDESHFEVLLKCGYKIGDVLSICNYDGMLGTLLPDGRLELTPLEDPAYPSELIDQLVNGRGNNFSHFTYAALDRRLVTAITFFVETSPGSYQPHQTVILRDTAGILPCPLPLTLEGEPVVMANHFEVCSDGSFHLLPDGGFHVVSGPSYDPARQWEPVRPSMRICYGPDGAVRCATDLTEDDAARLCAIRSLDQSLDFPVTDNQGRQWVYREKYFECYSPEHKLISRHRLPGHTSRLYLNAGGQACAITNDWKKYVTRVYRFS